jgi:hypothetical protein
MPHQCLKCGRVFEEGSSELLRGCPDCGGNRFFFTKEPLDEEERNSITREVGKDINSVIIDLMGGDRDIVDKSGNWVTIKPKEIRKVVEQHLSDNKKIPPEKKEDIDLITDDEYRKTAIEKIESEAEESGAPETIDIEKPGRYKIDLKGLLEEEPIIIQKDGSYTIHLPSIFKMIDKEK